MMDIFIAGANSDTYSLYTIYPALNRLFLGTGCFKELETRLFDTYRDYTLEKILKYNNLTDYMVDNAESSLTHETIHILLYEIGGFDAFYWLDKIDNNYEISGVRCL